MEDYYVIPVVEVTIGRNHKSLMLYYQIAGHVTQQNCIQKLLNSLIKQEVSDYLHN